MKIKILGYYIDDLNMEETLLRIGSFIQQGGPHQHVVVNVDKIIKAHKDLNLKKIINRCDLISADGMPVVWASHILGTPIKERITGIDLFYKLLERSEKKGWSVYFLGAREHVVSEVIQTVKTIHPDLKISGYRNGYWTPEEEKSVVNGIKEVKPDILFVAISSPKKEEFLGRYLEEMGVPLSMGVGGTFDVMIGLMKRAPVWMQKSGLEWFYRFLQEPRRMFRRYFIEGPYFFVMLFKELINRWASIAGLKSN